MEDNLNNLSQDSSRQGDKYVKEKTLDSGGDTEDDTILSVNDDKGKINGHECVDLGLSIKWATCNVGASSPTDYGNYYAWGETVTKSEYTKKNCKTYGISMGDISGNSSYDAARANWGGSWRLPTKAECQELLDNCKSEWTTVSGVEGRRFTSKKNGRSIFLPAAGYHEPKFFFARWRHGSSLHLAGKNGFYWSSTPYESNSDRAYELHFNSGGCSMGWGYRRDGQSVRPVSD